MENAFLQAAYVLLTATSAHERTWAIVGRGPSWAVGQWARATSSGTVSSPEGHVILPSPHIWSCTPQLWCATRFLRRKAPHKKILNFGVETKQWLESPRRISTELKTIGLFCQRTLLDAVICQRFSLDLIDKSPEMMKPQTHT